MIPTTCYYRVADFTFSVTMAGEADVDALLPSFRPFKAGENGSRLFDFTVVPAGEVPTAGEGDLLEVTDNDMGHLKLYAAAGGYVVEVANGSHTHRMAATADFSRVKACILPQDRRAGNALSSMLRIAFAQAILLHGGISIHAAAVHCAGKAYLFMGTSGTGKSTHASLWIKHIHGSGLLNDDNPAIRIIAGKAYVYGTPWSGKTACYRNLSFPIGGMVRLAQAPVNRFHRQEGVDAFVTIYPGCSVIAGDKRLHNRLYDTVSELAGMVTVGFMECLPDADAAQVCHRALTAGDKEA